MNVRVDLMHAVQFHRTALMLVMEEGIFVPAELDTSNQVLHALIMTNVIITLMDALTTVQTH